MTITFQRAVSLFAILATSVCFAHLQDFDEQAAGIAVVDMVLENSAECVGWIREDRIYLRGDRLFLEGGRVYLALNDEGDYTALPLLESDQNGSFLRDAVLARTEIGEKFQTKCPYCDNYQYTFALGCKNPKCPLNERLAEEKRIKKENARQEKERKEAEKREKRGK